MTSYFKPSQHRVPKWSMISLVITLGSIALTSLAVVVAVPGDATHDDHFAVALLALGAMQLAAFAVAGCALVGCSIAAHAILVENERGVLPVIAAAASSIVGVLALAALIRSAS